MLELNHATGELCGPGGSLPVRSDDEVARKLAMLIEGECAGLGATEAARRYGYSRQRYYQLLQRFQRAGSEALKSQKRGPKSNYRRTDEVVRQVIRHRFLDTDASAKVICQKLVQSGLQISERSVTRILEEYGLQKKTSIATAPAS